MTRRLSTLPLLVLLCLPLACDKGGDKKADDKKADEKKADEKKEAAPEQPKEKKLEIPWDRGAVVSNMKAGTTLVYKQTGKDAKGEDVDDDYQCVVKRATDTEVGTVCNGVNHPSEDKGANEVATASWSQFSPFFTVEKPETKLVERADLTVAAGTFDTVQVDITGVFGNNYTVWMIADKPGVYAKVHKKANANDESDQTDMTFELTKLPEE